LRALTCKAKQKCSLVDTSQVKVARLSCTWPKDGRTSLDVRLEQDTVQSGKIRGHSGRPEKDCTRSQSCVRVLANEFRKFGMKMMKRIIPFLLLTVILTGCDNPKPDNPADTPAAETKRRSPVERTFVSPPIVASARFQVGKTTIYDPAYVSLAYPGGDVPIERGVCTDVVVRALRDSLHIDLQELVHEDMKMAFSEYPKLWGLKKPDRHIDHRRVPNIATYFGRKGYFVGVSEKPEDYLPGDFVTCTVGRNLPHIMIVSDAKTPAGVPLVIHNIGSGTKEENRLFNFPITGHYRIKAKQISNHD